MKLYSFVTRRDLHPVLRWAGHEFSNELSQLRLAPACAVAERCSPRLLRLPAYSNSGARQKTARKETSEQIRTARTITVTGKQEGVSDRECRFLLGRRKIQAGRSVRV